MAWVEHARSELGRLADKQPGWAYRPGGEASVEPTSLAALGLAATAAAGQVEPALPAAAKWLAELQQQDGSLPLSASLAGPGWPTAHAMLVWQAAGGFDQAVQSGAGWLLARKGTTAPLAKDGIMGHDTTLAGWPWVSATHSWIEPTVMAILALRGAGKGDNPRVAEGLAVILDRAIKTGGWNYGNTAVFGASLRSQPAPTGMSLAALAMDFKKDGSNSGTEIGKKIDLACRFLEELLPKVRAPQSLGWGLLGLSAWDRRPAAADDWLADSARTAGAKSDPAMQWAFLLLAAGDARTLELLHVRGKP